MVESIYEGTLFSVQDRDIMSIEDGIIKLLLNLDYKWLDIKIRNMDMFYRMTSDGTEIILFLRVLTGTEVTVDEYKLIINNIKKLFIQKGYDRIKLLGLIFTAFADNAKKFCLDEDDHIIVDMGNRGLILYENLSSYFLDIISMIKDIVDDESYDARINPKGYTGSYTAAGHSHNRVLYITLVNTLIIIVNIIIFLMANIMQIFGEASEVLRNGALSWYHVIKKGEYYRIFTAMFLHTDFEHLINNMLVLFFVGDKLERIMGKLKYLIIYFASGIIAGIFSISYNMLIGEQAFSIGASGAIFGIIGAIAYILLANRGRLRDISSTQIKLFIAFSLYSGIVNEGIDNAAHIGGFIAGIIFALLLYRSSTKRINQRRQEDN